MNNFYTFLKGFKWFVLSFLAIILIITIPAKLHEHNYLQILLIIAITAYLLTILFGLNYFFNSMAINFTANEKYAYLIYASGNKMIFQHSEVEKIKRTPYRYIFFLSNNKKAYLSRMAGLFRTEKDIFPKLKEVYPNILF